MSKQSNLVNTSQDITVDSSGNVGIGTSSPASNLHVHGVAPVLTVKDSRSKTWVSGESLGSINFDSSDASNSTTTQAKIEAITDDGSVATYAALAFSTSTPAAITEAMRIDSSGNLLVGKTSSSGSRFEATAATEVAVFQNTSGTGNVRFHNSVGSTIGYIQWSGSSTSYVTSSDYRLKTDAQPMTGASARVQALNPVNFEWIADGTRVDGFLAHEAQEVVPEAVTGTKDAVDADGNPDYQGIDQSKLVPLLTAALQEALTEITDLKARVAALEAN